MDMRKAQVENGVVTNIILVDQNDIPDWCADWPTISEIDVDAVIGSTYSNGVFTPPSIQPTPEELAAMRARMKITFPQMIFGLVSEQWITNAEGNDWVVDRILPAPVESLISALPADQQLLARARALQPSDVSRVDPFVESLGAAQGKTPEELDIFFMTYAQV